MPDISFIAAFIGGILTFFSPCTLPILPAYLGVALGGHERGPLFKKTIGFIAGFSIVFLIFGLVAGTISQTLILHRALLGTIGGAVVILFALIMLRIVRLPILEESRHLRIPSVWHPEGLHGMVLLGIAFGLGWSPCLGPILGSILLLASTQGSGLMGALLLGTYSLGMAVPFLLLAAPLGNFILKISANPHLDRFIRIGGGLFLLLLGVLLVTGKWGILIDGTGSLWTLFGAEGLLNYM